MDGKDLIIGMLSDCLTDATKIIKKQNASNKFLLICLTGCIIGVVSFANENKKFKNKIDILEKKMDALKNH